MKKGMRERGKSADRQTEVYINHVDTFLIYSYLLLQT